VYACLYQPQATEALAELAGSFSPEVEITAPGTGVFSIAGLGRLIGPPQQIAAEIARRGAERGLVANLALAATPDAAVLAATNFRGVTIVPPGREAVCLGPIPLEGVPMSEELRQSFRLWGLRTLADVAALPPIGLAERLCEEGLRIYELACGRARRPLRLAPPVTGYCERRELEEPVRELGPLLVVMGQLLGELCRHLDANSMAARRLTAELELEDRSTYMRVLELPVAQSRLKPLLKLVELDLEAHPPPAPVRAVKLELEPVRPRRLQGGLFLPAEPEPERLHLTLARIRAMVGEDNAGFAELIDTHRPDAFRMTSAPPARGSESEAPAGSARPRLGFRRFRPPLAARVKTSDARPAHVAAPRVTGHVTEAAGPWRSSGDWWTAAAWAREEWDVALTDGGLYRLWRDPISGNWFVEGEYD